MLSCVREELRIIKVQWTWEDKEQVPATEYLPKIDLVFSVHSKQIILLLSITFLECLVVVLAWDTDGLGVSYSWLLIKLVKCHPASNSAAFHSS